MKTIASIELAEKTEDCYSFDRYRNWHACAALLLRMGFSVDDAETILRSKWTRWAADASDKPYGRATSPDLRRFVEKMPAGYFAQIGVKADRAWDRGENGGRHETR